MLQRRQAIEWYAAMAKEVLATVDSREWAGLFVHLRICFARRFGRGSVSTAHGIDFWDNILAGPEAWEEEGEYGDNFRKLFL